MRSKVVDTIKWAEEEDWAVISEELSEAADAALVDADHDSSELARQRLVLVADKRFLVVWVKKDMSTH
jgi:hypothetical protein